MKKDESVKKYYFTFLFYSYHEFAFHRLEQPTDWRKQEPIPKETPWKTLALNEQTRKELRV